MLASIRKVCQFLMVVIASLNSVYVWGQDKPESGERIGIWSGKAPTGDGNFETAETWITVHRAPKPNGASVVICPGGGYGGLVTGAEGHGIAKWLNGHGIAGIVLEYRLPAGRT